MAPPGRQGVHDPHSPAAGQPIRRAILGEPGLGGAALVANFHPHRVAVHRDGHLECATVSGGGVLDRVDATSLTRTSTSSKAGKSSPITAATKRRAWLTAEAVPGNHN